MFSTKPTSTQPPSSLTAQNIGWKWEVNHDGVIWSWYHPTPCYASSASRASPPSPPSSAPLTPSSASLTPLSSSSSSSSSASIAPSLVPAAQQEKSSLVDYWYIVHDGVVIPHVNDW